MTKTKTKPASKAAAAKTAKKASPKAAVAAKSSSSTKSSAKTAPKAAAKPAAKSAVKAAPAKAAAPMKAGAKATNGKIEIKLDKKSAAMPVKAAMAAVAKSGKTAPPVVTPKSPLKAGAEKPKDAKTEATGENKEGAPEGSSDAPLPLLDLSDAAVKKMIKLAKKRGYVTHEQINAVMPSEEVTSDQIEDVFAMLNEMGINVVENEEPDAEEGEREEEEEDDDEEEGGELVESKKKAVTKAEGKSLPGERTDDPVRMYLREMGSVELLSREGEIAIAKRIEAGREAMIAGLCESPLTFQAIIIWRDELNEGKVFLRDIIDLEATYAGPDAVKGMAAPPVLGPDAKNNMNPALMAPEVPPAGRHAQARRRPRRPGRPRRELRRSRRWDRRSSRCSCRPWRRGRHRWLRDR